MHKYRDNISVVVLTRNEKKNLEDLEILQKVSQHTNDLIVVDGHSVDGTAEYAKQFTSKVFLDDGKGKGQAIRQSIEYASNEVVLFIDSDGSHDPDDIPKLVKPIFEEGYDHVGGSRTLGGSDEYFGTFEKFMRVTGSHIILLLINYRFGVQLSDSQNGFRCLRKSVFEDLDLVENKTTIEQEMIIKSLRKGYKVGEVPAHEYARLHGDSKISLRRDSVRYVYSALKYSFF